MTTHTRGTIGANRLRVTNLLTASAVGVYLLVVVGATTALLDGAGACPTWPACNGHWLPAFEDPAVVVAWGHRVTALLVGGLLFATAIFARRRGTTRRVGLPLWTAVALYPIQIVLGGITVLGGASTTLVAAHLLVAMAIFSGVLLALLGHLETDLPETATDSPSTTAAGAIDGSTRSGSAETSPDPTDPKTADSIDPQATGVRARALAYVRLTKPKLWWLLCLVAVAAMGLAAGPDLDARIVVPTLAGGVLAIGASGTFNHVLERDLDRRMARTADRPLVAGQIPVRRAIAFGLGLTAGSTVVFVTFVNVLAAALGLLAVLFYTVVYTLILKPNTDQNVVIGGAVGAFPALIGWAAVEHTIGLPAVVLGGVIFLWTPAHFYNLALAYREDYARAGIPMLPVVRGEAVTRRHVLLYLGATMLGAVSLGAVTELGWAYAVTAAATGSLFLWAVVRLHRERTEDAAFRAFHASNAYLGSLLVVIALDAIVL